MMNKSIDISDHAVLRKILQPLKADAIPLWGKMKPQQMVEHLVDQVEWTNGKKIPTCDRPADEAYQGKMQMVYTDAEIPKNVFLENLPESYIYPNIEAAINALMLELDAFDLNF